MKKSLWKTVERPGFFGKKKAEKYKIYDDKYGEGNWRVMWKWNGLTISWLDACLLYEDAYFEDSKKREDLWMELISEAKDVYDHDKSDVKSGLDYLIQDGPATHIQDITIRRVVLLRRCWKFEGKKLIQIRSHSKYWGELLSPGRVRFHKPQHILDPPIEFDVWWNPNSVEDFYQRNKVLQVKK